MIFLIVLLQDFLSNYSLFNSPFLKYQGLYNPVINKYGAVFKIIPSNTQESIIFKNFNSSRFVYNKTLEYNNFSYKQLGEKLTPKVTDLKSDFFFLNDKDIDSLALANAQQDLRSGWTRYFDKKAGLPNFKKKNSDYSYKTNNQKGSIRFERINNIDYIKLPKLGLVRIIKHKDISGKIKNATIKYSNGVFTVSLCFECFEFIPKVMEINNSYDFDTNSKLKDLFLGLDFSCKEFYVDSDGNLANYENYYYKNEKKLAKLQRQLSKKQKGSNNYNKLKTQISKLHKKIANQRKDFLHKLSSKLAKQYKFIVVEDINLRAMSQTLHLGKSIMSKGFGMFRTFLSYKLDKLGGLLITINKWFASSKICNCCGYKKEDLNLKDRTWICPICNNINDRDFNAAKNIRDEGYGNFLAGIA